MKHARVHATSQDFVLDVGSGGFAHSTADVLLDKFIEDTERHRSNRALVRDRPFVQADIAALPFKDKTFDYVIANQIIEHVPDPARALDEISRVGRRGYISVPSEFEEMICRHPKHVWVFAFKDGELLIKQKLPSQAFGAPAPYGGVFWMLHEDPLFKRLMLERGNLFWVNLEWTATINYRVVPADCSFYDYDSRDSVAGLLTPTRPESVIEYLKWQLQIHFDWRTLRRLNALRTYIRRSLSRVSRSLRRRQGSRGFPPKPSPRSTI